jgi:dienelactone hydrolase
MWRALIVVALLGAAVGCGGDDDEPGADAGADAADQVDGGTPTLEVRMPGDATPVTRSLHGEIFEVHAAGLSPGATVTLRTHIVGYSSAVDFIADDDGGFDTGTDAPASGTYEGVDPDGIVWSMARLDDEEPNGDQTLDFELVQDDEVVATATLERFFLAEGARTIEVDDAAITGTFYVPAGEGPFPAMLVFGGSEGGRGTGESLGQRLASHGVAALGLAYFADEGVPDGLYEIPLEYFGHALEWLAARPEVAPGRIGAMGGSRGGELALLLGATFPEVRAVVAFVPSGVMWGGFGNQQEGASWTWQGAALPYIPLRAGAATGPGPNDETIYYSRRMFEESVGIASAEELEAATILVEQTEGPVLMLAGDDDQLWPSCVLAEISRSRLEETGHTAEWGDELVCYPEAGHSLLRAGFSTMNTILRHPANDSLYELGGTPVANAHAGRDAWARIDAFLAKSLTP